MRSITVAIHFWKWFKLHNSKYRNLLKLGTKTAFQYQFNELQIHVRAYCKWLGADIMPNDNDNRGIIVITAYGNPRGFKKADQLVAKAPPIPGWKIMALRPPNPINEFVVEHDIQPGIGLDDCWFRYLSKDFKGTVHISVYVRCILPGKQDHVRRYIFLTLENLLGERSKALDVEVKDIESRWLAPAKAKLHKLEDLPGFIGGMNSGITIGPAGKIDGW